MGANTILLIPTPATRSITLEGAQRIALSCRTVDVRNGGITALLAGSARGAARSPVSMEQRNAAWLIRPNRQGPIECTSAHPASGALTFTERGITIRTGGRAADATVLDLSALQDVNDVRILGGIEVPFGGDRVRLLSGDVNVVSVEWTDMIAQEQRDIVLVVIGALSALAAASVIEAIRPAVESRSGS